ncbi:MAG: cytochrome c1, partial [Octadecabacter sp.]
MKMFRKLTLTAAVAFGLASGSAYAAGSETHIEDFDFSFEGPFGAYDTNQLQRG